MAENLLSVQPPGPRVLLFGVPELHAAAVIPFGPERRCQLLALLALRSGEWVPRDQIAALFWPDRGNAEARRNLRKVVFRAHALAGAPALEANDHALRWTVATDLQDFQAALAAQQFNAACALRRGPLLAGIDDPDNSALAEWLATERSHWHFEWHHAATLDLRQRAQPAHRIPAAMALLQADPLDEEAVAALIDAQLALGQVGPARRSYQDYAARLADELGVEPARGLRDRLDSALPAPQPLAAAAHATPDRDAFVGRRTELAELGAMLARADCRLLTILGPGGIGKSSLARQALLRSGAMHAGGTVWVELQDLDATATVLARLAQQLGVELNDSRDPIEQLARRLSGERTLIVLDNAEHLTELPALLDRLLGAAISLCLLITSRARTHCADEWLLPLAGLAVPDEDSRDLEAASAFDAVRLFTARATAAQRGFLLAKHLGAVIDIAEAVAGMPLAIELAASWVRLLPPEQIARELHGSTDLLERDPAMRAEPARPEHRSMRAVLDRSWTLLAPRERDALAALSVFQGGFTRSAALRVATITLPLLSSLADKSLIATDADGRFGMHPLVAAFAARQLEEDPERVDQLCTRHAEFFALHLAALAPHAIGDQRLLVAGVDAEFVNCRVAWLCAVEQQRGDLVYAMVRALWSFFENRGRLREGIELLSPALALPEHGPAAQRALARLRHGLSMLHHRKGNAQEALEMARGGINDAEQCGDTEAYVGCVLNVGMCLWAGGRAQEARGYFERGLAIARARDDRHCIAWSLGNLGACLTTLGENELTLETLTLALAGSRELGDQYNVAVHLTNLGSLLRDMGQWAAARAHYEDGLRHCAAFGIESVAMYLRLNMGRVLLLGGEPAAARVHFEAALTQGRERGMGVVEWAAELGLARIEIGAHAVEPALQRLCRVVRSASEHASRAEIVAAATLYGDALAALVDASAAAQVWRTVLAQGVIDSVTERSIKAKLAALLISPQVAAATPSLSLEEVLHLLQDQTLAMTAARRR